MADKSIPDLNEATQLFDNGLMVVYQSGETKKMQGQALKQYINSVADVDAAKAAADRAEAAAQDAERAAVNTPYIGANGNWFVFDNATKSYKDSGVDASITVDIADITMLPYGSAAYITNSGTATDPVFHLFIPNAKNGNDGYTPVKGVDYFDGNDGYSPTVSISEISGGNKVTVTDKSGFKDFNVMDGDSITSIIRTSGTGAAGTVDTYTVTTSSGGQYTFTVYNGSDGKGSGDMLKSVYDPTNKAQDVFAYADGKASTAESNAKAYTYSQSEIDSKVAGAGKVKTVNSKEPDANGNIALVASDVGARPNTWTPTAEEVGARPSTWTPTASDVGARPSTWTPTKSDVGLGNVANERQYSASNPPPYPVTSVNGQTGDVTIDPGTSYTDAQAQAQARTVMNRSNNVNVANTSYTTYMARGEALFSAETNPTVNGTIAWKYE